jgi:putative ABC transport system permease protein
VIAGKMNTVKVAVFLALKSITRGDWRVLLLTISMLILVYINLAFAPALLAGAVQHINEKTRNTLSGDIVVQSDNYPVIVGAKEMVSMIETIDGVAAACARNSFGADIRHDGGRFVTAVYAIDPVQDSKVFDISEKVIEGSYLESGDRNQILLGVQIAGNDRENLELYPSSLKTVHAGDTVSLYYGSLHKEYTVKGIFFTEFVQSDITAYITEEELDALVPEMQDMATSIHVKLEPHAHRESVMGQIRAIGLLGFRQPLKLQTWEDVMGFLRSMTKTIDQIITILRAVALVVAAITVFIVTYIDLANRRRQIGIERAIGITSTSIVLSYVLRGVIYAAFGVLAAALIFVYVIVPIEAAHPFHFPFGDVLLPVDVSTLTASAFILCGVAIVSAFIPAWQAIRTKIIDAIWSS